MVEFYIDGEKNKRDAAGRHHPGQRRAVVTFTSPAKLAPGLHQGMIRLTGESPTRCRSTMSATSPSTPSRRRGPGRGRRRQRPMVSSWPTPWPSTARQGRVGMRPPGGDAASAPVTSFRVDRETVGQFRALDRAASSRSTPPSFSSIVDQPPTPAGLGSAPHVRQRTGGGLVVAPGETEPGGGSYDSPAAGLILPGHDWTARRRPRIPPSARLTYNHPLFSRYPKELDPELTLVPDLSTLAGRPLQGQALGSSSATPTVPPALLERIIKGTRTGRVLLWSTPLALAPRLADRAGRLERVPAVVVVPRNLMLETIPT